MFAAVLVSILFASSLIPADVDASDKILDAVKKQAPPKVQKPEPPKVKKPAPPKANIPYPDNSYANYQGYDGYDNYVSDNYPKGKGNDYYQPKRFVCKYDRDCGKGWECSNGNCVPFCEKCYEFSFIVGQCVPMCAKNAVCNTLKEGGPEGKCICKNCPGMDGYDKVANCIPPKGAKGLCFSYAYRRSFLKNFGYPPPPYYTGEKPKPYYQGKPDSPYYQGPSAPKYQGPPAQKYKGPQPGPYA